MFLLKNDFCFCFFIIEWGWGLFSAVRGTSAYKSISDKSNSKYLGLPAGAYTRGRLTPLMDSYLREGKARRQDTPSQSWTIPSCL